MGRSAPSRGEEKSASPSSPLVDPLSRPWSEAEAFAYCRRIALGHYENFPVGSLLMPQRLQPAIHSLYAFMRTADDFADENRRPGDEAERLALVREWGRLLDESVAGAPRHPIFIAVKRTLDDFDLPVQWLRDLLHAFEMDVTVRRYETYADLLTYCRYSANPVGRLILALSGYRDDALYGLSDHICTGLQLANHWQDVAVDLKKDRIYLPREDMRRFSVEEARLPEGVTAQGVRALLSWEVERARECFRTGRWLPECVQGRLRYELRLTWNGGMRVLDKIESAHFDVFQHRPVVTKTDWLFLALRALRPCRE